MILVMLRPVMLRTCAMPIRTLQPDGIVATLPPPYSSRVQNLVCTQQGFLCTVCTFVHKRFTLAYSYATVMHHQSHLSVVVGRCAVPSSARLVAP